MGKNVKIIIGAIGVIVLIGIIFFISTRDSTVQLSSSVGGVRKGCVAQCAKEECTQMESSCRLNANKDGCVGNCECWNYHVSFNGTSCGCSCILVEYAPVGMQQQSQPIPR